MPVWPLVPVLVALVVLVVIGVFGRRLVTATELISRAFWCPARRQRVSVEFRRAVWDHALVDVERCSAFAPPSRITCDKACLHLTSARNRHEGSDDPAHA